MNLYLSSYRIGDKPGVLQRMASGRTLGFIPNAVDHLDLAVREASNAPVLAEIRDLGIDVEMIDLRDFFGADGTLRTRITEMGGVWVRGGNVFVLRQAMRLSGFDALMMDLIDSDFLYAGYSAGICVLGPTLEGVRHVDDPTVNPYPISDVIWQGLGILDDLILPHYKSDHPESRAIDRAVAYCRSNGIPYKTLRDGEVIVIDECRTSDPD